jgi:glutathione S-transferase
MKTKSQPLKKSIGETIVVKRIVKAPCERVFQAWTEPRQLAQWFSPEDVECRSVEAEVKVGGAYRIQMASKKGDHIAIGKYKKITANKLLRFTFEWEHYAMPKSVITVEFEDLGKTTRVTLTHEGLPDDEDASDHNKGWTSALKKFARLVEQNKIKA